ncbi:PhnD/SsuA/transferrin family substrate-binding protein [Amycolatopsis acidicola]|uniref:PhnD/SsuA/transferrin family substrate-binding protein n=1 Tax=Amycolatopsis acidicola TaxID=2596893 RepID=A0A5N0UNI4_9PSEU|nr:ABC transporter substrate-binding protein [Amycolatopsis acidicola]KAA9149411.1 PhnD/SsuA/transferrin family substrate-binding protein [Amycolatopsis acidicola]
MPRSALSPSRKPLVLAVAAALAAAGCASGAGAAKLTAQVSDTVPQGTSLSVAVHTTEVQLKTTGEVGKLPFTVTDWPVVQAGPDVIQAFRAHAVDVATNAGIPPIQAHGTGLDAKIVAVQWKQQPQYQLATAPGSDVRALGDLRGKKIAFSPGQAQGVVVLRTLEQLGLTKNDVQLVELNSPQFLTALQSKQVDVAPLAEPTLTKYLTQYGKDGARGVVTPAVDALTILWAPTDVLADPAKAAAIKAFIPYWARSQVWAWENPAQWRDAYYVKDQQVSPADGQRIIDSSEKPVFPASWDAAIKWEQETVDLVSKWGYFGGSFDAGDLFDRRFESVASASVPAAYRGGQS